MKSFCPNLAVQNFISLFSIFFVQRVEINFLTSKINFSRVYTKCVARTRARFTTSNRYSQTCKLTRVSFFLRGCL